MTHLRYCLMGAHYHCNINEHAQKVMKDLGITYQHATPQSMGDQWWFWNCENLPNELPRYLTELKLDPMECVGNGLNQDNAESIRDYKKPTQEK